MVIPNLLIIAGTGNKPGKTSLACRIIEQFRDLGIVAVKITPNFHETTPGLELIFEKPGYSVFRETNPLLSKDTSRMLQAGASQVFFAKVTDDTLFDAFREILRIIPRGAPLVCESPALRKFAEPGLFIIMTSEHNHNSKHTSDLQILPHLKLNLGYLMENNTLPLSFISGKWSWPKNDR